MISETRRLVPPAPWLKLKNQPRISEMPEHLDVAATDKFGKMYNLLRKELGKLFTDTAPLSDFRGLIAGDFFTREIYRECGLFPPSISTFHVGNVALMVAKREVLAKALAESPG